MPVLRTHIFTVLHIRFTAEVFRVKVFKVRLANSDRNADSEVGVVDERHEVLINHVLSHTAPNAAGGAIAIFSVVQFTVDVHCVVCDAVELLLVHFIQRLLFVLYRLLVRDRK